MTGDVINLRQVRKLKARSDKEQSAAENRVLFGRTKSEKAVTRALKAKVEKALDQGKLDKSEKVD